MTVAAPLDRSDEASRALSAFVRAEFQSPVLGLRGLIVTLAEDAAAAGLTTYRDDLARMQRSGDRLLDLVSSFLDEAQDGGPRRSSEDVRHDLRTPLSAILGYGELIAEEARDRGDTQLFTPLADTLEAAGRLLREMDRLVAFSKAQGDGPQGSSERIAVPDVVRHAKEVVDRLHRHSPPSTRTVTGRILVVDDNASMRDLVSRRLTRDGHKVSVCGSGSAALDMTARGAFDLMLLDLMMPGMSGLEVLEQVRVRAATLTLPVIVISALDEVDAAVRCIEAGADDFLSKPLNETLLRARITSSLERKFLKDREQDALSLLQKEQERSEALLRNVLPASIVERLRAGETVIADHYDDVTVLFCDLVGFTAMSAGLQPVETLGLLNEIFSGFDQLTTEFQLEKIKTIGDAYMVVGGLFEPTADHAKRVTQMACRMLGVVASIDAPHQLAVRVGVHTGPAVAGIVGRDKFFYDVWGDTVNTASRLEGASEPGRVHVSTTTHRAIDRWFTFETRPLLYLKGIGSMQTFYVDREI